MLQLDHPAGQTPKRRIREPLALVALVLTAAVLVLGLETLHRQGAPFAWVVEQPVEFLLNLLLATLLGAALLALTGRVWLGLGILSFVLGLGGLVNAYKQSLIRHPLFPWDIFLHRHAADLLPNVWNGIGYLNGAVVFGLAVLLVLASRLVRFAPLGLISRGALAAVVALAVSLSAGTSLVMQRIGALGVQNIYWEQIGNYRRNGLMLAFTLNMNAVGIKAPASYKPEVIAAMLPPEPEPEQKPPEAEAESVRPNVIVVMSEAFSDPTTIPNLSFSADPLPNLHRLQKEHRSGAFYSPVYGGGTANTEFEFLTGHSMRFLPVGSVPYQQYVKRKMPSLASIYAERGYRTVALHTYHRWFWEREHVYQHLGFHEFIGSEDLPSAPKDGDYISDSVITDEIIRAVERTEEPLFVFAVTMEGHGPYAPSRYPQKEITVDGPLTSDAKGMIEAYVEGLRHSDRELQRLVDYFSTRPEPTYIVFFGDHLPLLTPVYEQAGLIQKGQTWKQKELEVMHRIPLLVWQNGTPVTEDLGAISPSLLGPWLLQKTGAPLTPYMRFLSQVGDQMPVMLRGLVADHEGRFYPDPPERFRELEERWWMLQYDVLFGAAHQLGGS